MSLLADFDPLTSPIHANGSAGGPAASPSSAAAAPAASASAAPVPAKQQPKFDGTNPDFLCSQKWQSTRSSASHSLSLCFCAPKPRVVAHEEDAVEKALREREEKAKADAEKAEQERLQEEKRQEEARAAAAAGKEEIKGSDKLVELPGPALSAAAPSAAAAAVPVDPAIAKAQQELEKEHEKELAARNRYADQYTFKYNSSEEGKQQVEYVGAFQLQGLQDKTSIVLKDVSKTVTKEGEPPVKSDVQGSLSLSITADGSKITGRIESEEIDFDRFDSSNSDLASILGF